MGNLFGKENIIPSSEINEFVEHNNKTLERYFMYARNSEGNIPFRFFCDEILKIDDDILAKGIFTFFSNNNKMSFSDLKYFYTIFKMNIKDYSNQYKMNFISQLLFNSKSEIESSIYKNNVKIYFPLNNNSENLEWRNFFLDHFLVTKVTKMNEINNDKNIIYKKEFDIIAMKKIKNFNDFSVKLTLPSSENKNFEIESNYYCDCVKPKENSNTINDIIKDIYLVNLKYKCKSEYKYEEIEKLFKQVEIDDILIGIILNYLKQKTLKKTIDIYTLINLLYKICLCKNENEKAKLSFELLSYPNNEINNIDKILLDDKIKIKKLNQKDYIDLFINSTESNKFTEFIHSISFSFDKINLIPFIVFEQKPYEPQIIKNVINFILKDNSTFDKFCKEKMKFENKFYAINIDFKNELNEYLIKNNINEKKPIMNLDLISKENNKGRLKENLIYENDYFIIPESLYIIFKRWFLYTGNDIILEKITYNKNEKKIDNENIYHPGGRELINEVNDIIFEIEFYPIHTITFCASEIYNYLKKDNTFINTDLFINFLKNYFITCKEIKRSQYFSRKIIMNDVFSNIKNNYENLIEPINFFIFNGDHLIKTDLNDSFESKKISNFCIIIIDTKFDNEISFLDQMEFRENEEYVNQKMQKEKKEKEKKEKEEKEKIEKEDKKEEINKNKNNNEEDKKEEEKKLEKKEEKKLEKEDNQNEKNSKLKEKEEKIIKIYPIGLSNIGNTCYLSSVLQCLINLPILKDIILNKKINFFINRKSKNSHNGDLIDIFLKLIEERWLKSINNNNIINPKPIKNIIGQIKKNFNSYEQQDANELLNFLLDELHEELNLKNEKIYIPNPDDYISQYNTNEELSNIYWANSIRRGTSFINSIFSFQLKSILTCQKCKKEKCSFETMTNLYLPIPLSKFIDVEIVLIKLPFCYKIYYDEINEDFQKFNNEKNNNSKIENLKIFALEKLTNGLFKEKNNDDNIIINQDHYHSVIFDNEKYEHIEAKEDKELKEMEEKIRKEEEEKQKLIENQIYNNYNSVPIKLKISLNKTQKLSTLIDKLKNIKSLELESNKDNIIKKVDFDNDNNIIKTKIESYTSFIICNLQRGLRLTLNPISKDMIIDDCLQENSRIYVYEVLNSNGINEVKKNKFNYEKKFNNKENNNIEKNILVDYSIKNEPKLFEEIYKEDKLKLKEENEIISLDNKILYYKNKNYQYQKDFQFNFEYILEIRHYYTSLNIAYLFDKFNTYKIDFYSDFILFNNTKNNFTALMLYDYIWEKYKKFLSLSNKSDNEIWWRSKNENNKICYPFLIRITIQLENKDKTKCAYCPWYKFCPGCILNPFKDDILKFDLNYIIHVEWCKNLKDNELLDKTLKNLYEIQFEEKLNEIEKIEKNVQIESSLEDCLKLFFKKEKLEDLLSCPYCQLRQEFTKYYIFDKLPQVLIISLKRFKYASMYRNKINTFIKYPLENLEINNEKFDLYAVINHFGSLNSGHYTSYVKIDNDWYNFDDSLFNICKKENIMNKNAYILFYINKSKPEDKMYFNILKSILDKLNYDEDKKYLDKDFKENKIIYPDLFYGEPIMTDYNYGYFIKKNDLNDKLINIKFPFGSGIINIEKINKEIKLIIGNNIEKKNEDININISETTNTNSSINFSELHKTYSQETINQIESEEEDDEKIKTPPLLNGINNQDLCFIF